MASQNAPITLLPAPGPARVVIIVLRGAMDGLSACAPYGDPQFGDLKRQGQPGTHGYVDLDGYFSLHPALVPLLPLWRDGDLAFVHAVATPYRDQRSHFDGQDILEYGRNGLPPGSVRSGWLNRLLEAIPGANGKTGCAVGSDTLSILTGDADVHRWSPSVALEVSDAFQNLCLQACANDTDIAGALQAAFETRELPGGHVSRARDPTALYAATRLNAEARIAAFSIDGWDTHSFQERNFARAMDRLTDAISTLKAALTPANWSHTSIAAVTEFGRTVRFNGTGGTDHGTAGAMLLAGGAINGGQVFGEWPGLSEADLYDRRDLCPTRDVRAYIGWLLRAQFGLSGSTIETTIFPGLDMGDDPSVV